MSALLWTAGILTAVSAYLAVGVRIAQRFVTNGVERDCRRWPLLAESPNQVESFRRERAYLGLGVVLVWPVIVFVLYPIAALADGLASTAPPSDTEIRQQLAERNRRIAELERQLGMKP